ncbi:MAG: PrgI family protein [Erysipelotrichaceae bacterium]
MIYVKVPKEIRTYEDKILAGLSFRELAFGGIAAISAIVLTVLNANFIHLDSQILSYIIMIIVIPVLCCGFVEIHGMKFEKYIGIISKFYLRKQQLIYSDESLLWKMEDKKDVTKKIKKQRKCERKKYKERD